MQIIVPAQLGRDRWLWWQFMSYSLDSIMSLSRYTFYVAASPY